MNLPPTTAPEKLYRYRSIKDEKAIERAQQIVVDSKMFFAPASSFNDPFELCPPFSFNGTPGQKKNFAYREVRRQEPSLTNKALEKAVKGYQSYMSSLITRKELESGMQRENAERHTKSVGVCCFTGQRDNLLVWAHYADSHAGICLEFSNTCPIVEDAQAVRYSETRVPVNIIVDTPKEQTDKILLTKSEHWAYEEEWRAIRYSAGPGIVSFEPEHLTGIILGARASKKTEEMVRDWLNARSTPCTLYRATVSQTRFELAITPL